MDKAYARKMALELRKGKNKELISNAIVNKIINSNVLSNYKNIGIYYPIGDEISVLGLMDYYKDKNFYLPQTREEISFISYKKDDKLVDAKFHTKEPLGDITSRDKIECFIIPCVAISKDLKRIGYGKGYYDRYLKSYNGFKIGIVYSDASNLDLELEDFDLKLDLVFEG